MSADIEALARRAVCCKHWRWMPGMRLRVVAPNRVSYVESDWLALDDLMGSGCGCGPSDALPDLDDPATLGCLLALVREAWGGDAVCVSSTDGLGIAVTSIHDATARMVFGCEGKPLGARLVDALEAAP